MKKVRTKDRDRDILQEASGLINGERGGDYGPINESFDKVAILVTQMLTEEEREAMEEGRLTGSIIIKCQLGTKLVRESYSPHKPDHLRDTGGYTLVLDKYKTGDKG